jgi:uncharacterized protein (TIGR03067 family)
MRAERILAVAAVMLLAFPAGRADDTSDEKPLDPDLKKLQGKWRMTYHETAGVADTDKHPWTMEVKGCEYTLCIGTQKLTGRVRIDSAKSPKQVDYSTDDDNDEVQEFVGIYVLDGDTYKTCDVVKDKTRPTEFKTKDPTGQVAVWKRVKVVD